MYASSQASNNAPFGQQPPEIPLRPRLHTHFRDLIVQLVASVVVWVISYRALTSGQIRLPKGIINESLIGFAVILGGYWLMALVYVVLMRAREGQRVKYLFTGDYLTTWHYSGPSWQAEYEARRKTDQRKLAGNMLVLLAIAALIGGLFFFVGRQLAAGQEFPSTMPDFVIEIFIGAIFLPVSGLCWVLFTGLWTLSQRYRRAKNLGRAWIVFGSKGYYHQLDGIQPFYRISDIEASTDGITFHLIHRYGRRGRVVRPYKVQAPANITPAQIEALAARYRDKRS
jgi:hypothetical protein